MFGLLIRYNIGFSVDPTLILITYFEVYVSIKLDNYGYGYGVVVKKNASMGKPKPFQIARGLDSFNIRQPNNSTTVTEKFVSYVLYIKGLEANTIYDLYLTAGSAHPGYPDLMSETLTQTIQFTTLMAPVGKIISSSPRYKLCSRFKYRLDTPFVFLDSNLE